MVSKKLFVDTVNSYKNYMESIEKIEETIFGKPYVGNLFESAWATDIDNIFDGFLKSNFSEDGVDLVYWHLFEDVPKIIYETTGADLFQGKRDIEINVESLDDLYDFMIRSREVYCLNGFI